MPHHPWYRTAMRPVLCALAVLVSSSAVADTDWIEVDRVAIVIDHDIVLASEVELELSRNAEVLLQPDAESKAKKRAEVRPQVIEQLIERALFLQRAKASMITVDDTDVNMALDEIKKQNQLDDEGLDTALTSQGWNMADYRVELHYQLLRLRTINQLVRPRILVSDAEVRAEYDRLVKDVGTDGRTFDEAKSDIRAKLTNAAMDAKAIETIAEWRAATYIDVRMP